MSVNRERGGRSDDNDDDDEDDEDVVVDEEEEKTKKKEYDESMCDYLRLRRKIVGDSYEDSKSNFIDAFLFVFPIYRLFTCEMMFVFDGYGVCCTVVIYF
jgi:hypothetical protein